MDSFLEALILTCLQKVKGERSVSGTYHLLKGKKSSQTIQDSHLFGISRFFGIYPVISREELDSFIQKFTDRGFIQKLPNNNYAVTGTGMSELDDYLKKFPIPVHLNGWAIQNTADVFWRRLSLLIQTLSHLVRKKKGFYPIQKDISVQKWIKQYISAQKLDRQELSAAILSEILPLLEQLSTREREIFVLRLSSSMRTGHTYDQIARMLDLDETYVYFLFVSVLHFMVSRINWEKNVHPHLSILLEGSDLAEKPLTQSTHTTYQYILNGMDKEAVARIRNLKVSTIEDHIVELALTDARFDTSPYLNSELEKEIASVAISNQTRKLKEIKEHLTGSASYFQIRLVLARYGEKI
ncbi:helix-turn-helix domain-containing protein [Peribacillus deserti]|uniref:Helicase Helix-turn-helix domain-containing protein n=1 Tax=Peribacillus deserti TaxID=673318 RepID=A0A2N5M1S2_9BACI|nr:helix-turn-helix domain-containing protein [Peribacillus deserti]PLT28299.1 hypothetical protein CUU66_18950 [Peribacillus deserti]